MKTHEQKCIELSKNKDIFEYCHDQPITCPKCGSRTDWDWLNDEFQEHECLSCKYNFLVTWSEEELAKNEKLRKLASLTKRKLEIVANGLLEALELCYMDDDTNNSMPDFVLQKVEQALNNAESEFYHG